MGLRLLDATHYHMPNRTAPPLTLTTDPISPIARGFQETGLDGVSTVSEVVWARANAPVEECTPKRTPAGAARVVLRWGLHNWAASLLSSTKRAKESSPEQTDDLRTNSAHG